MSLHAETMAVWAIRPVLSGRVSHRRANAVLKIYLYESGKSHSFAVLTFDNARSFSLHANQLDAARNAMYARKAMR
jgi:hypothetical protein